MVTIFEQYLKVASLNNIKDNMDKSRNESPMRIGVIPDMENNLRPGKESDRIEQMMTISKPMILPDSRLQVYDETPSPNQSKAHLNPQILSTSKMSRSSPFKPK